MCLDEKQYEKDSLLLRGNFFTEEFRYIEILFLPCQENTQKVVACASFDRAISFFKQNQFQLMFYDNFLDVTDTNQIIKTFVNPKTFMTFDPDYD